MLPTLSPDFDKRRHWAMDDVYAVMQSAHGGLRLLVESRRIVVIRDDASVDATALLALGSALGTVIEQPLGRIVEIADRGDDASFLFTHGAVPLHWDGALGATTPRFVILACARAPSQSCGGATVLIDTVAMWRTLPPSIREE